jgi:hypothetical protein
MPAPKRPLPPALAANRWQPGQSGNPSGHSGAYGTAIKLAQRAAPKAVRRLIELMDSQDERVAAVASNSILDRAFGKPTAAEEAKDDFLARLQVMTPEERVRMAEELLHRAERYVPAFEARAWEVTKAETGLPSEQGGLDE